MEKRNLMITIFSCARGYNNLNSNSMNDNMKMNMFLITYDDYYLTNMTLRQAPLSGSFS